MYNTENSINHLKKLSTVLEDLGIKEYGWIDEFEFCVWVSIYKVAEFTERFLKEFGGDIFLSESWNAYIQHDCLCINLSSMFDYDELRYVFPYKNNKH